MMKTKGILTKIRTSVWTKAVALKLIMLFLVQMVPFTQSESYALTSGPGQQEYASFEPASTSDMVDLYSGGFTYNIPIMNIPGPNGGYPINLAYHSGVGMDEEASWVGLGWTLNVGAINRMLQGVPDDINGENITYEMHQKEAQTASINSEWIYNQLHEEHYESFGINLPDPHSPFFAQHTSSQIYFNNYRGFGYRINFMPDPLDIASKGNVALSGTLNLSYDSQNGIGIAPGLGLSEQGKNFSAKQNFGLNYNSGSGINSFSFTNTFSYTQNASIPVGHGMKTMGHGSVNLVSKISYQYNEGVQKVNIPNKTNYVNLDLKLFGDAGYRFMPLYSPGSFRIDFPRNWQISISKNEEIDLGIINSSSFGSLYTNTGNSNSVNDYTRSSNGYNKKTPYLPSSKTNEDAFSVSGQGTGGMFMVTNTEILSFSDRESTEIDNSISVTGELGISSEMVVPPTASPSINSLHIGVDGGFNHGENYSGRWITGGNSAEETVNSSRRFKLFGEQSGKILSNDFLAGLGGDEAVKYVVESDQAGYMDREYEQLNNLIFHEGSGTIVSAPTTTSNEIKRANVIKYLTDTEAEKFGISRIQGGNCSVRYYDETLTTDAWVNKSYTSFNGSHISEIQVLQQDGSRYVYGLPAYNYDQINVSTSVTDNLDHSSSIVDITEGEYSSTTSKHFSKTTLPDYAHTWMLTAVVSSDYIDSDNIPGPSDGDMGYWVKINYVKKSNDYAWRVPYEGGYFYEGNKGDASDNMGSFSYGTKELYYVHSVETKTHIAVFELDSRWDGKGASDDYAIQSASPGSGQMYRLKSIKLYLKREYFNNDYCSLLIDDVNTSAKALQTVELDHDWSLCQNVPNNNNSTSGQKGKLTLKAITFKSENSERGELSPYEFTYASGSHNPDYEVKNMDRWGNYKDNTGKYVGNTIYPFEDFPYTEDAGAINDDRPEPLGDEWALVKIDLPTGGEIEIEYEPNDYAYVEDKKAMRMLDIVGVGNALVWVTDHYEMSEDSDNSFPNSKAWYITPDNSSPHSLGSAIPSKRDNISSDVFAYLENDSNDSYRIYFELDKDVTDSELYALGLTPTQYIAQKYVDDIRKMYFSNFTVLRKKNTDYGKDYVKGFVPLLENKLSDPLYFGMCKVNGNSNFEVGYVTVDEGKLHDHGVIKCNPMTRLAIEHLQVERPDIVNDFVPNTWNDANSTGSNLVLILGSVLGALDEAIGMIISYNTWAFTKDFGKYIELNGKSKIRLLDPDQRKLGGGGRVKSITMKDNWVNEDDLTDLDKSEYGLTYYYDSNGDGSGYSTGVVYEPQSGKEESSLYQPINYSHSTPLKTNKSLFVELPHMENYYPGPSVGYGKVTVKSLSPQQSSGNNEHSVAPISVYEFYTPKDFPIYGDQTDLNTHVAMLSLIPIPTFYTEYRYKKIRTQGYSIIKNNMAGKLKKTSQYSRNFTTTTDDIGDFISSQEYIYNTEENNPSKLSSKVQVLSVNDETSETFFQTALIGQDVQMFNERNENRYNDFGLDLQFNLEVSTLVPPGIPIIFPSFYTGINRSELSFKTLVTHKVIHRSGILKKVITKTDNSTVVTENIAFDIETGQPLLTKVYNQYEDPIYSLSYPAHWYYPNMGAAHKNEELRLVGNYEVGFGGEIDMGSDIDQFTVGDELYLEYNTTETAFVHVAAINGNFIHCVDEDGEFITDASSPDFVTRISMKASGYKNHLGVAAGGLTAKVMTGFDNSDHATPVQFALSKVLNASAVEFSNVWQTPCYDCEGDKRGYIEDEEFVNPFKRGLRGLWRVKRSYAYNTDRIYQDNSKEDGVFADYEAFPWLTPNAKSDKWVLMNTVAKYSSFGFELENKDALNNYSSAIYGYDNSLVTAIASNSRYSEMFFDGFEDYYYTSGGAKCENCKDNHFRFYIDDSDLSSDEAHTGNYSIKVNETENISKTSTSFDYSICEDEIGTYHQTPNGTTPRYEKDSCDCVGEFAPRAIDEDKKFTFSAWLKHDWIVYGRTPVSYDENMAYIELTFYNSNVIPGTVGSPILIKPSTKFKIIDGWQKLEMDFEMPVGAKKVKVNLINLTEYDGPAYFDDLRMHPADGNMNSYVYDRTTMKLMAELDANNYATFYVYDEAGNLVKMKKETEKGIKTITEGRKDIPKAP